MKETVIKPEQTWLSYWTENSNAVTKVVGRVMLG